MTDATAESRNARGDWRPDTPVALPPIHQRPFRMDAVMHWLFGFPGFLWPLNAFWVGLAIATWAWFTPDLAAMATLELWWIALIVGRNLALTALLYGGLHYWLYMRKGQGTRLKYTTRPLTTGSQRFLFRSQVRDNMFRTLVSAVPIYSAFEVLTWWLFANGWIGLFDISSPVLFWGWFAVLLLLAPAIHALHFHIGHWLLHQPWLYRKVHAVHHRNSEVCPWSGLAMHPVEHLIYFSTVLVQWLVALHPVNLIFQLQITITYAALAHTGFEKLQLGSKLAVDNNSYFHYLHHQHFECNYGGGLVPFDWMFGTAYDGSPESFKAMRHRLKERRQASA